MVKKTHRFYGPGTVLNSEFTSHENGEQLESTTETFIFSSIAGAEKYRLRFFDFATNTEYFNKTFTEAGAVVVDGLPSNGVNMSVRLGTLYNGWWSERNYNLTSVQSPNEKNATLMSHTNGQRLTSTTETFVWDDVGAEKYILYVKKIMYGKNNNSTWYENVVEKHLDGSATSFTVKGLPVNNAEVLVRLHTKHSGWGEERYVFLGTDTAATAELSSPLNNEVLLSSTQTFKWDSVLGAEGYLLKINGFNVASFNKFSEDYQQPLNSSQDPLKFESLVMEQTITDLPKNGARFSLILSTKHNGYWEEKEYRLKGAKVKGIANAVIKSHVNYQIITTPSTTITWDNVDADAYYLRIEDASVSPRIRLHDQIHGAEVNSVIIDDLPQSNHIRVGLCTKHGEWWGCEEDGSSVRISTETP